MKFYCVVFSIFILFSCSQNNKERRLTEASITEEKTSNSDGSNFMPESASVSKEGEESTPTNFISSRATASSYDDGVHRFIRSAQMKFKVKAVPDATFDIEDIVIKHRGFVLKSSIFNEQSYSTTINISEDSALIKHNATLVANIKLKVPQLELDSVLKEIAPLALEIDYRELEASDVTLQILSDSLKQIRVRNKSKRIVTAIDNKKAPLQDVIDAENVLDNTLDDADRAILSSYKLNDMVDYSIIDIQLYQTPTQYSEKI